MIDNDRPIKSDPKYIEEFLQKINKVQVKPFLKKKTNPSLPCHASTQVAQFQPKQQRKVKEKSKAEIYAEIKEKNLKKFGQKKVQPIKMDDNVKKIDPKKITVGYKPKVFIQTQQFKKKDFVPRPKSDQNPPENKEKIEYEKLIDYFNKEMKDLQKEKEEFNKVAEKLRFKQKIRQEEGLFYSQVKSAVQKQLIKSSTQPFKHQEDKEIVKTNHNSRENQNRFSKNTQKDKQKAKTENLSKTYSVEQIRKKLQNTCEQMQLIKTQLIHQNFQIKQHRYQIFQAHLLPSFQPQMIYDYMIISKLKYNGNPLYQSALAAFNSKFEKENKECDNVCQEEHQDTGKPHVKERFIREKRVSKYGGWTEVWIPGKQRLMANSEGYKVVWLANGDVMQEFSNSIKTYYSKTKQIYKLEYKDLPPIYYHEPLKQIWRYLQNNSREIVFQNGRREIIPPSDE